MPAAWKNANILVQGRRPADAPPTRPPKSGLDFRKHQLVGQSIFQTQCNGDRFFGDFEVADLSAHFAGPLENLERCAALGFRTADDLGIDFFINPRHAGKPVWAGELHVLDDRFHAAGESGRTPHEQGGIDAGAGKDVGQGEKKKHLVTLFDSGAALDGLGREGDVVVGQHSALGNAGRARSVDDPGGILGCSRLGPLVEVLVGNVLPQCQKIFVADHPVIIRRIPAEEDDFADIGNLRPYFEQFVHLLVVFGKYTTASE
jgi:hypothetical protein